MSIKTVLTDGSVIVKETGASLETVLVKDTGVDDLLNPLRTD